MAFLLAVACLPAVAHEDCRGAVRAYDGSLIMAGDLKSGVLKAMGKPDQIKELVFQPLLRHRHGYRYGGYPDYGVPKDEVSGEQWIYRRTGVNAKTITVNFRGPSALRVCQYLD